ncbi:hypothetical protein DLJ49_06825 [Rhodovulum sp. 12E13]|uniref:hypothetical protein n=1 Tax=Rhodovulum sp. 12E13 TaxID=2203891 RepID=UPI000E135907|nr:hypothetical protein [Rhodovulum sp. 12E13]RDC73816.1 hypothetical protein DLJ49_06825 [Rhodovulum sp. 12E13]
MSNAPKPCLSALSLIVAGLPMAAAAQTPPVPGVVEGTIDGAPFSVPLDCSGWGNEMQRMAYSAGDDRRNEDIDGDGYAFVFSYLVPADNANGTLIAGDRTLAVNSGFRPGPDAPRWDVGENTATFSGPTFGQDVAQVEVTVDCAPREASARGFTGRVTGSIAGTAIDEPLFCDGWDGRDAIEARTDEGAAASVELFVIRASGQGTIEAEAGGESYQIVAAPLAGTEFEIAADSVTFSEELTSRDSGESYTVDLTFDCAER